MHRISVNIETIFVNSDHFRFRICYIFPIKDPTFLNWMDILILLGFKTFKVKLIKYKIKLRSSLCLTHVYRKHVYKHSNHFLFIYFMGFLSIVDLSTIPFYLFYTKVFINTFQTYFKYFFELYKNLLKL